MTELLKLLLNNGSRDKPFRIKLLGDSITHGAGGTGFCQNGEPIVFDWARNPHGYCWANLFKEYLETRYNCKVVNNACFGTKIEFIIDNYNALVDEEDDFIICAIGTNNRTQKKNGLTKRDKEEFANEFYNNLLLLNNLFKRDNKKVLFISNIPASKTNERSTNEFWRILHMKDINSLYKSAQYNAGFLFVSLYDLFSAYLNENNKEVDLFLSDGLHPNDEGHKLIFELLKKELEI